MGLRKAAHCQSRRLAWHERIPDSPLRAAPLKHLLAPLDRLDDFDEVIDVRTPLEFADDHIPGALNAPVMSNEERVLALSAAYKWVDTVIASKPHLFQSAALASYYEYVLDTAQSLLPAVGESSVSSVSSLGVSVEDTLRRFIESAAEKAVEKCPHEVSFWNVLDQAQQQRGDHKAATHTRWRRDKALGSA